METDGGQKLPFDTEKFKETRCRGGIFRAIRTWEGCEIPNVLLV